MRISHLVALILIFSTVSLCGIATRGDVTLELHGGYSLTPGLTLSSNVTDMLNSMTNATYYYKGSSVRCDSDEITEICNYSKNAVMIINNHRRLYCITKRGPQEDKAFDQLFGFRTNGVRVRNAYKTVDHVRYYGHKCLRMMLTEELLYPDGAVVGFRAEEIDAVDVKGYTPPRNADGKPAERGVTLKAYVAVQGAEGEVVAQTQAVSISSARLAESTFTVGKGFHLASREEVVGSGDNGALPEFSTGFMSAKPVDPYAGFNQFTGLTRARTLIKAGKFDAAADLCRSLATRGLSGNLGPVYIALGDHAMAIGNADGAWGWYNLVVSNSEVPDDLAHAHFGLAHYYADIKDNRDAAKQLGAILALPGAKQADKDQATAQLQQLGNS